MSRQLRNDFLSSTDLESVCIQPGSITCVNTSVTSGIASATWHVKYRYDALNRSMKNPIDVALNGFLKCAMTC